MVVSPYEISTLLKKEEVLFLSQERLGLMSGQELREISKMKNLVGFYESQ